MEVMRGDWLVSVCLIVFALLISRPSIGTKVHADPAKAISEAHARSLLGVGEAAGRAEIEAAYRRLMQRAHPDRGGTPGLAAQLNLARDRLLKPISPGVRRGL
jgi:hypothetical protein